VFAVSLIVTDSQGAFGNGTTAFVVGSPFIGPIGPVRSTPGAAAGVPPLIVAATATIAAFIAILVGVAIGTRMRGEGPSSVEFEDPKYAAYRTSLTEAAPSAVGSDPADELF
jgi:hypothetical protein